MKLDLEICRISVFIIGETVIQIGNQSIFLVMILLEPVHSSLIGIYIWGEKHACCWKIYLFTSWKIWKYTVGTEVGTWYDDDNDNEACNANWLKYYLHSPI